MSDIPTEIVITILRLVPVESLFRFRSVCKSWCHAIDDPTFAKHHIHGGVGQGCFFSRFNKGGKVFLIPIKELVCSNKRKTRINATNIKLLCDPGVACLRKFPVPSCNGLILLTHGKRDVGWRIWNPFTEESLEVRGCGEISNSIKSRNMDFLYNGLGFDEANDDYVVVTIVGCNSYLYSVNSKEWRRIGDFPAGSKIVNTNGVFAYGALHWVCYSKERIENVVWIAALDVSTGNYRKIALPSEIRLNQNWCCFGLNELSGCLFFSCSGFQNHRFVVWMINDYGCEDPWIKMISLEDRGNITPIAYLKSKEKVLLYKRCEQQYWWYDVGKKCAQRLCITVNVNGIKEISHVYEYVYNTFSSHVFPASLIRFKRSDVSDGSVSLRGTSKRKRKRAMAIEKLPLKIFLEGPKTMTSLDCPNS